MNKDSNPNNVDQSLVSVIMPFLNSQLYIEEAIESVLHQTYSTWELLLVDDGSNDRSSDIALHYTQKYPEKIRYFEHEGHQNCGASASRNLAFRNSKGKYIAFLDSDDVWLPFNLEHFTNILDSYLHADIVYGPTQWWYSWTGDPEDINRDSICNLRVQPNQIVEPPKLFAPFFLTQTAISPCTCSLILRREVIEAVNGFENEFRYIYTDQVFYTKLFLKSSTFITSECGAKYRQHPTSSCATVEKTGKVFAARSRFLFWLESYVLEQGVKDPDILVALQKAMWVYRHPILPKIIPQIQLIAKQLKRLSEAIAKRTLSLKTRRWLRSQWQSARKTTSSKIIF